MLIAAISDTHMGQPPAWLDRVYDKYLASADVLLHCGDITSFSTWSYFLQHPNFTAVRGNCDWDPQLADSLDTSATLEIRGLTIGMTHGWGPRPQVSVKVAQAFGASYDLVFHGHTHQRLWQVIEGVQICNPGSLGESGSLALVTVHPDKSFSCEFVTVDA
ncbi:metallophosphoesterase family protein [Pseudodesulfovibrio tunisiensis]|uniref:metallophosphoesterase family protein n=1 Tax=Pseudodesulfovibrio tunisiensis TaxID=463192 RepID=UPI001FB493FA|nr:metallophosphoesterase family protein [Pseudodesulfovibrio tunisiensis]